MPSQPFDVSFGSDKPGDLAFGEKSGSDRAQAWADDPYVTYVEPDGWVGFQDLRLGGARSTSGYTDTDTAKRVLLSAAQSGSGRVRLTTQAYADDEAKAVTLLTGSSDVVGDPAAAILAGAGIAGLTGESTWDDAVTAIANS